jgi:hypothetical protein
VGFFLEWAGDHAVQLIAAGLSAGALTFAALTWRRGCRLVTGRILPLEEKKKGHGELRGMQLVLPLEMRARRNTVFIAGTYLQVDRARIWGRDQLDRRKSARLTEGEKLLRYWLLTDVRRLPADKRWEVGWQDSEDKRHRLAIVGKADIRRLTTEPTQAERQADEIANLTAKPPDSGG